MPQIRLKTTYTEAESNSWFSGALEVLIYQCKLRASHYHKTQHFDSARVYYKKNFSPPFPYLVREKKYAKLLEDKRKKGHQLQC